MGEEQIASDNSVKTAPSPLYFDDLRAGVRYDARKEIPGWNLPDFDDSDWADSILCPAPLGEKRICEAESVLPTGEELLAKEIRRSKLCDYKIRDDIARISALEDNDDPREGFLYDFGINNAGIVRLKYYSLFMNFM